MSEFSDDIFGSRCGCEGGPVRGALGKIDAFVSKAEAFRQSSPADESLPGKVDTVLEYCASAKERIAAGSYMFAACMVENAITCAKAAGGSVTGEAGLLQEALSLLHVLMG